MSDTAKTIALIKALGGGGGGGGSVLVVHDVEGTLDKTYAEILTAAQTMPVFVFSVSADSVGINLVDWVGEDDGFCVEIASGSGSLSYIAESANGYPSFGGAPK